MKFSLLFCLTLVSLSLSYAQKKVLDHEDFAIWNSINGVQISNDGEWVIYRTTPGEGDAILHLYHVTDGQSRSFDRVKRAWITADNSHLLYRVGAQADTLKEMRRRKVKKEDLPGDSLVVYNLRVGTSRVIPHVMDVHVPEKWSGAVAYQFEPQPEEKDTSESAGDNEKKARTKKYSKKNGYPLVVLHLATQAEDTLDYVTDFALAEEQMGMSAICSGRDSTLAAGVYVYAGEDWQAIKTEEGAYSKMRWSKDADKLAFYGDTDTTEARIRPVHVYLWSASSDSAEVRISPMGDYMDDDWRVSDNASLSFSEDGTSLFFGVAPPPVLEDTSLLDEEKVSVEVWHYKDSRMYTQQSVRAGDEKRRTYLAVLHLETGETIQIGDLETPNHRLDRWRSAPYAVLTHDESYLREMSWSGMSKRDVYISNLETGEKHLIARAQGTTPSLSPGHRFLSWYSRVDSTWYISGIGGKRRMDTRSIPQKMYNELHDSPSYPGPYGSPGWLEGDERMLVYDRYDIWSISPTGRAPALNLTNGREDRLRYRYIRTDPDQRAIDPDQPALLHVFNEDTKASGYAYLNFRTGVLTNVLMEDARFASRPTKARDADVYVFTRETFEEFRDLHITTDRFATTNRISDANPQQKDYKWGTAELFEWTAFDGKPHRGLLIKPADFNPNFKYPMIVNFYEKSSDGLYNHRAPAPHRSTINYSFYASRGYVIFNPDVHYKTGYPGESAYNSVVSGTQAVIEEGFVDPERVGTQGHSWGGYQIADLITRTDMFACAESGAPVVNMISAYGGIRWQTGLSRMFQYEKTQSRLGATLWENPDLYLENSPVFNLDKVTTPVLIMHNDGDGHVPWYQGIEFFVAMRRLGKPAWMLNYNDEPHWPLKLQNRKDFNIRMQQFFDHYLLGAPMPKWMRDGVPATEKGIRQGYELLEDRR